MIDGDMCMLLSVMLVILLGILQVVRRVTHVNDCFEELRLI